METVDFSMVGHMILIVDGTVSNAKLATLFGLYGEVSANEEAIVHQLVLLCNVTKHRQNWTTVVNNLHCF